MWRTKPITLVNQMSKKKKKEEKEKEKETHWITSNIINRKREKAKVVYRLSFTSFTTDQNRNSIQKMQFQTSSHLFWSNLFYNFLNSLPAKQKQSLKHSLG